MLFCGLILILFNFFSFTCNNILEEKKDFEERSSIDLEWKIRMYIQEIESMAADHSDAGRI